MNPITPLHGWLWVAGCLTCTTTVIAAAAGGHKNEWPQWKQNNYSKAVQFGLSGGVGMLLSSLVSKSPIPGALLLAGTLAFSAPIMYKCFTDDAKYGKVTMFGGAGIIGGWLLLGFM